MEDLYRGLERLGPGDDAATRTALRFVGTLGPEARIADIGCGTGAQTTALAAELSGRIVAVDSMLGFLEELDAKIERAELSDQVKTLHASMEDLPFKDGELDLIWSEGAIYNIGFRHGLSAWSRFLKPRGVLAVSEICWFRRNRPQAIEDYWSARYAEMDTPGGKLGIAEKLGYVPLAHFLLQPYCWTENYYAPLAAEEPSFLKRHPDDLLARDLVEENQRERATYDAFGAYYGYAFFVLRKPA